jgi:hypothetical protein
MAVVTIFDRGVIRPLVWCFGAIAIGHALGTLRAAVILGRADDCDLADVLAGPWDSEW